jgi:hypothetical protein
MLRLMYAEMIISKDDLHNGGGQIFIFLNQEGFTRTMQY